MPTEVQAVSVIIPVFNDPRLEHCLQALSKQTVAHDEFIVVDNGSDARSVIDTDRFPEVRVIREDRPGSYIARNPGVRAPSGSVIAFTNADCLPEPDLERGVPCCHSAPSPTSSLLTPSRARSRRISSR